jgi:hypothetical protein
MLISGSVQSLERIYTVLNKFTIGNWVFVWGLAPKNTLWWERSLEHNTRRDFLFGLSRIYHRQEKLYTYSLHIGRLVIKCGKVLTR